MSKQNFTRWVAAITALVTVGFASASDRDFLREVAAAPNLIFILDTSGSMVGSPEVVPTLLPGCDPNELVIDTDEDGIPDATDPQHCLNGALVNSGMVPASGDDPYSRMGIAKQVLGDFLEDVGEANVALAGYAQAQPTDAYDAVPTKHWVYEARASDRFHMIEATWAYRMGVNENFANILVDNPGEIYPQAMIGYKLYFDPETTAVTDRFGPVNANQTGAFDVLADLSTVRLPYDLMPLYFASCFEDGGTVCVDNVFPVYSSGVYDGGGTAIAEQNYYGDPGTRRFPDCVPYLTPTATNPDDGCLAEWDEDLGTSLIQHKRRIRLEVPSTFNGNPNHFLAVDAGGSKVGNLQTTDGGPEDYDLDGFADPDLDGDSANDWILYVNAVEEQNQRTCAPATGLDPWTPTPTYTETPTITPTFTPTFTPTHDPDADRRTARVITFDTMTKYDSYAVQAYIRNGLPSIIDVERTVFEWTPRTSSHYVDFFAMDNESNSSYTSLRLLGWDRTTGR